VSKEENVLGMLFLIARWRLCTTTQGSPVVGEPYCSLDPMDYPLFCVYLGPMDYFA